MDVTLFVTVGSVHIITTIILITNINTTNNTANNSRPTNNNRGISYSGKQNNNTLIYIFCSCHYKNTHIQAINRNYTSD